MNKSYRLLSLCLLLIVPNLLMAESPRFISNEAIINAPYHRTTNGILAVSSLDRIEGESFSSLDQERLSGTAVRVSIRRKLESSRIKKSERFLKSRSPCKAPTIRRLLRVSKNLSCEPNWEGRITLTPNDTFYGNIYSASASSAGRIHLPEAWELTTGSASVVIGVIDTGIDYNHLDLQANIWTNPGEIAGNSIDDDANGYVDDIHGIDRINADSDPFDDQSHGTHVAGTIGAVGNNTLGVVGVAWDVQQIACKAFNTSGVGTVSAIVGCLNYLINLKNNYGFNIVATSNSYGGFPYTTAMYNAIAASRDAGMVYVAGAGNNTRDNDLTPFYPASFDLDNIVSVGAIDSAANIASFSNFGLTSVDISAPGVSVLSTIPGNQYAYFNGTSMATPHVTGAVALLMAYHPDYLYSQVINSILSTGTAVAGLAGKSATGAILNVAAALQFDAPIPTPTPVPTVAPTPQPTEPPSNNRPDLSTAKIEIGAVNTRARSEVTCSLSALNAGEREVMVGYQVKLSIKEVKNLQRAKTKSDGAARFIVRPPANRSYRARCLAALTDPDTNQVLTIRSRIATLKLKKR